MGKESYYFSHDSNAITDTKILNMRADYGLEGYGLYWAIIEMLRNEEDYKLGFDKNTFRAIKTLTNTNIDIGKYINDCINEYKLFIQDDKKFFSQSLLNRMQEYEKKRKVNRENGKLGGRPKKENPVETEEKPNGFENETEKNQRKGKERKGKEKKVKENKIKEDREEKIHFAEFVSMTNAEYERLVSTHGKNTADQCITILDNYKGSSGRKYQSDYRAILSWVLDKAKQNKPQKQTSNNQFANIGREEGIF